MSEITRAIGVNIREQQDVFTRLAAVSPAAATLSHVRLLDILAWNCGQLLLNQRRSHMSALDRQRHRRGAQ
jgi:hypothetical protein